MGLLEEQHSCSAAEHLDSTAIPPNGRYRAVESMKVRLSKRLRYGNCMKNSVSNFSSDMIWPVLERWIAEQSAALLGHAGLPGPAHFRGALKRLQAGPRYRFPWHRDHRGGRLLGMSINLSEAPCEGGVFEQRLRWETEPSVRIHSKPRDLHLFDVSDSRRVHRVTQLTAGSRVVFAGWWRA